MLEYKGYIATVEAEDGVFFGRVAGLRDVITFEGSTFAEVEQAFHESIDDYLAFCAERGEPPDRPYSGSPQATLATVRWC
jgi:predicted HicB family RNase H-like nuclease